MRLLSGSLVVALSGSVSLAALDDYVFVPLNQPGIAFSRAFGVNNNGQVALEAGSGSSGTQAFRWTDSGFTILPSLVASGSNSVSIVRAINDAGQIVGNSRGPGGIFDQFGARWDSNNTLALTSRYNNSNTFFQDINNAGVIVGNSNRAFMLSGGEFTELRALNDSTTASAQGINANNWVVGSSQFTLPGTSTNQTRATVWKPDGTLVNLGIDAIPGVDVNTSVAFDVNDNNVVVGYFGNVLSFSNAFVWTESGGLVNLGAPGGRSSFANAINNSNQIVGYASFEVEPTQRAYLWQNGQAIDLNSVLPVGSGWVLNEAYDINEEGWIVGRGTFGSQTQAWLMRPIPEPMSAGVLLGAGLLALRRRRT